VWLIHHVLPRGELESFGEEEHVLSEDEYAPAAVVIGRLRGQASFLGMRVFGTPGSWISLPPWWHTRVSIVDGVETRPDDELGHWDPAERQGRSLVSPHWHGVTDEVHRDAWEGVQPEDENPRLRYLVDVAREAFDVCCLGWETKDTIVVTAWNWATNEVTTKAPGEIVDGATKGLIFCSEMGKEDRYHWCQSSEPTSDEGLIACPECLTMFEVGESGPHLGVTDAPCGHPIATGDHLYRQDLIVLGRGPNWTAVRDGCGMPTKWTCGQLIERGIATEEWLNQYGHNPQTEWSGIHPDWDVIQLPLRPEEGRFLAGIRLLPLVSGRSDVDIVIMNVRGNDVSRNIARTMNQIGITYGSFGRGYSPVDLGSFFSAGCVFWPDKQECLSFLSKHGLVYGADETWLIRRAPIAVPMDHRFAFHGWKSCTQVENVTWIKWSHSHFWAAHPVTNANLDQVLLMKRGIWPMPKTGHYPFRNSTYLSPDEAIEHADEQARRANIRVVGWDPGCVARRGERYSTVFIPREPSDPELMGPIPPGAMWRRLDNADCLRSSLRVDLTQGISPKVWEEIENETGESDVLIQQMCDGAIEIIDKHLTSVPHHSLVLIASVWSQQMLDEYRAERGHLCHSWIWFTEKAGLVAPEGDLIIRLPTSRGTAFIFQLARLLPFAGSTHHPIRLSVINDLETDWYPREDRLKVGEQCMTNFDIVFPAMNLNTPCPFQDVYGKPASLKHLRSNLVWTLGRFGWVYGVDEVWGCVHDIPTVAIAWKLGGAATPQFANPKDATVIKVVPEGLEVFTAKAGNFWNIYNTSSMVFLPKQRSLDLAVPVPTEPVNLDSWNKRWERIMSLKHSLGDRVLVIFLWGTRGDRIPLYAAARKMRETNTDVLLVELCDISEGLRGLDLCETERGHHLVVDLARGRAVMERCSVPFLHPSYFGKLDGGMGVVLRPTQLEAGRPRGGLPAWIDWIVPLISFEAEDIWIAKTDQRGYFPRSCNGVDFLRTKKNVGEGRKAVVLGSSLIPVPEKYADWEVCPAGDHSELLCSYERIACAGGAGVVQTAKACGVKDVEVWTRVIDRTWHNQSSAGVEVRGEQPDELWYIPVAYLYPSVLWRIACRPTLWFPFIHFVVSRLPIKRLAWTTAFIVTCTWKGFLIMPTFDATVARFVLGPAGGLGTYFAGRVLVTSLRWYRTMRGLSWPRFLTKLILVSARILISNTFIILTTFGLNWRNAFLWSASLWMLPSFTNVWSRSRIGLLDSREDTGVWMGWTPVMLGWVPLGIHVVLYDADTGRVLQGKHESGHQLRLGGSFRFAVEPATTARMPIWFKTNVKSSELPAESGPAAPYSMVWNCQTQVAILILRSGAPLGGLVTIALALGLVTAFTALTIGAVVILFAGTASLTAIAALRPMTLLGREREVVLRAVWGTINSHIPRFAPLDEAVEEDVSDEELRDIQAASVTLASMALMDGVPQTITFEALARSWAILLGGTEGSLFEQRRPNVISATTGARATREQLAAGIIKTLLTFGIPFRLIEALARVATASVESLIFIFASFTHGLAWLLTQADGLAGGRLSHDLREFIEVVADEAGRRGGRLKNAWAPMAKKDFERLRFADWVAMGLKPKMSVDDEADPFTTTIRNLNRFAPSGEELLPEDMVYQRAVFLPKRPRATEFELRYPSLLHSVSAIIDPTLQERAERYERMGATPGTDGLWLASDEVRDAQIRARYLPEGKPWNSAEEALMEATVEYVYEQHKAAFEKPGVVPPEVVAKNLVRKYSPGLPFIPKYKRRQDLWQTGWMDSIIQATYAALEEGKYPPQLYHAFPKMQIVRKNREVTAEGLTSVFVSQVAQLEVTKRSFWDQANMGMGAPITARYLGEVFEKVNGRKMAFTADATDFDSNCPPILFEGLSRLYERGVKDGGIPAVASIQRAKYIRMQKATIVDLPTGRVYPKNRGGATGQSSTSWDNHWAFRICMIMMWSYATGKDVSGFYETNTVHNTGDDNLWGTDDDITPEDLANAAKELFGIDFKIEATGEITNLSYLSRRPIRRIDVEEDAAIAGLDQEFVAGPDRERFLLRRSAVLSRYSGAPMARFAKAQTQRNIGHLLNCAFDRELYSTILREYMEDVDTYIGVKNALIWNVKFDKDGLAVEAHPRLRFPNLGPGALGRYRQLSSSLRCPSYEEVLKKAGKEIDRTPRPSKFYASRFKPSFERVARDAIAAFRTGLYRYLPDSLVKLTVNPERAPVAPLLWTPGWPVEKYVWRVAHREGKTINVEQLSADIRQSPFAPATDVVGFWWFTQIPGVEEALLKEDFRVVRGRMVASYLAYHLVNMVASSLRIIPLLGLVVEGWMVYTTDLPRLYAALSSLHWVATGGVSPILTSLMPRDPYASYKIAAVWSTLIVPDWIAIILDTLLPGKLIESIVEAIALVKGWRPFERMDDAMWERIPNKWLSYVGDLLADVNANPAGIYIVAETATGKSTEFPAALLESIKGRVWLVMPRVVLREDYQNPWLNLDVVSKLSKDSKDNGGRMVVTTYGHYLARLRSNAGPGPDDIVLLDEFGENEPDMGLAYLKTTVRKFLLSATPDSLFAPHAGVRVIPIPRPFPEPTPTRLALPVMELIQEALRERTGRQRLLVIVPGLIEAHTIARSIESLGREAHVLSGKQRKVPLTGDIVATQVVDSGIDIPGITIVIDKGKRIVSHKGETMSWDTDASVDKQRRGRTGRRNEGYVYTHTRAGTGEKPVPYPTYTRMMEEWSYRDRLFEILGIENRVEMAPLDRRSRLDPRMELLPCVNRTIEVSLNAWWALSCSGLSNEEADKAYDQITTIGWTEHTEGISQMLSRAYGQTYVAPRSEIAALIRSFPFQVVLDGMRYRPLSMRISNGHIVPV
jgi:hypothetical protein